MLDFSLSLRLTNPAPALGNRCMDRHAGLLTIIFVLTETKLLSQVCAALMLCVPVRLYGCVKTARITVELYANAAREFPGNKESVADSGSQYSQSVVQQLLRKLTYKKLEHEGGWPG